MKAYVQPGERRGNLTIVSMAGNSLNSARHTLWHARCDCGADIVISTPNFRHKDRTPSCMACGHVRSGAAKFKHGDARKTRLYRIWANMRWRCESPTADNFRWYGGRGIRVCDAWQDFVAFREWANANGYADDLTIDRFPNGDGNYEPGNCRWVTQAVNSANEHRRAA
jgi:hypothetical protein